MNCNLSVYLFLSAVLSMLVGCNKPILMSMGTSPMPVYHEPRWSGEQDKKWVVSADAFVGPFGEGLNVRDVFSLGGNLSVMYRFWNPLFVQGAFAGSAGNLKFGCSDIPCTREYGNWIGENDKEYSFWALQERVLLGSDFVLGDLVQLGLGAGVQFFQADGQYEEEREKLEKVGLADNVNGKNEIYPVVSYWIGVNLGDHAKYGVIKSEVVLAVSDDLPDGAVMTGGLLYYHPSGFHGGYTYSPQMGVVLQVGKTFSF